MDMELPLYMQLARAQSRRQFLKTSHAGLGAIALACCLSATAGTAITRAKQVKGRGGAWRHV